MNRALQQLRYSRKKRDPHIKFDITKENIHDLYDKQEGCCALSGLRLTHFRNGSGIPNPYNISIDRIDPDLDYTEDNIQLVCHAVNMMKARMSDEQFIKICTAVSEHRKRK